jgi:O-antigen/teichoic acid export membrane protein
MTATAQIAEPSRESVFRPAALLMCGRMLSFAATFFIPVVLVRVFSQAEFGTYKQLFLIQTTLYLVAQCGMATSLYYFLPRTPQMAGRYVANSVLFLGAVGLAACLILAAGAPAVARWMNNPNLSQYLVWIGVYLFLMTLASALEMVLITRHRYLSASITYALSDLGRAAGFIIPALLFGQLVWLLKGAVIVAAIRVACTLFYYRREFRDSLRPDFVLFKQQLRYAVPFGLAVLLEIVQGNLPSYVVAYLTDPATFAIFAVGCLQIPLVDFAASPTSDVMMVRMQECLSQSRLSAVLEIWHDTTWKLALLFFPLVALVAVAGHDVILLLFTAKYLASVPIFIAWASMILLAPLQCDGVLRVFAETRLILVLNLVRVVIIAGLLKWSLSVFHLLGPVLVIFLALLVFKAAALVKMRKLFEVTTSDLLPWRKLSSIAVASAAAAAIARAAQIAVHGRLLPELLLTSVIFSVTYAVLIWILELRQSPEGAAIVTAIGRYVRPLKGVERLGTRSCAESPE